VKEFWIYTGLRLALFAASFGIVVGVWFLFTDSVPVLWSLVIALLVSGIGSYIVLNRQREALARRVQTRAEAMTAKIEQMKAKEDADDDPSSSS
jgi:ABC-type bacteriocin/lantibiotic exporter with double-glycine peptidase domain